ncbi:Putative TolA protein [hydrothermal vent metagenome]|uniref:TolA protein n=1 Tax=hydrothermal vent metagenome TaxID=652676 RepID=A0A3B1BA59_9ZZZZ
MLMNVTPHTPILPWTETEHDRRFRIILLFSLLLCAIVGIIISYLPAPQIKQQALQQVSPRLAKLILQKKQVPKPIIAEKITPKKVTKKKHPKNKKAQKKKSVKKTSIDKTARARKQAQNSGLLAMQDELADLRDSFDVASLQNHRPQQNKGKVRSQPEAAAVLSAAAGKGSSGINTRNLKRHIGGTQALAARRSSKVESALENSENIPNPRAGHKVARSQEEIELVFQKNKGAIYSLYNRALRRDPTLQGKVLLELTIAPSGQIIRIRILSSELAAPKLEKRLLSRIKLFHFAARDVDTVTVTYPIDFLPS